MLKHTPVRVALAVLVLFGATASEAQQRSDIEIVELIMSQGPEAAAIRAQYEVTRREQQARLAYPNPVASYSREGAGFAEFYELEQTLPIFGVRASLERAGVAATQAAEAERDARLALLRSQALSTVARLISDQARLQRAEALAAEVERLIEILRTREREGEGSRFDRVRAEQELRDVRQLVGAAAVAVSEEQADLSAMLPTSFTPGVVRSAVNPGQASPALEELVTQALSARSELRALQLSAQHASLEAEAAGRSRFPGPHVFGGVKRGDASAGRETGGVFGVSVPIPLFDTGGREAERWNAERTRLEAQRAAVENRIRSEIAGAWNILRMRQAALSADAPGSSEELVQIAQVAYREGEVGILELLDAMRSAARASARTLELQLDARLAQIALERAAGGRLWP